MSEDMYSFIVANLNRLKYDLENGVVFTPKGTNGTLCKSTGYLTVKVNKRKLQVHQILSVIYFGKLCIGLQVNHIDGNKLNNKKRNLEVVTQLENLKHQRVSGLLKVPTPKNSKVDKLDLDGNYICTYSSVTEASKSVGLKRPTPIYTALKGYSFNGRGEKVNIKTAGGFKWRLSEM